MILLQTAKIKLTQLLHLRYYVKIFLLTQ